MGVPLEKEELIKHIEETLDAVQNVLLEQATAFRDENIVDVTSYDELKVSWMPFTQIFTYFDLYRVLDKHLDNRICQLIS